MIVRIATRAWNGSAAAETLVDTSVGVDVLWVELDGHRFDQVIGAKVKASVDGTVVTLRFWAAAEMVLVGADGEVISEVAS